MTTYPLAFFNLPTTILISITINFCVEWCDFFHIDKEGKDFSCIVYFAFSRILTSPLFMIGPGSDKKLSTKLEVL